MEWQLFRMYLTKQGKVTTQLICGEKCFCMFKHGLFLV